MRMRTHHEQELDLELACGVRSAVRFAVHLPIRVIADGEEFSGESVNVSSGGALLRLDRSIEPGKGMEFLVEIPAGVTGMQNTAAIHCTGKALRVHREDKAFYCAVVIDEYRFQ